MPGTPGPRTGLASILISDPVTGWRTAINAIRDWLETNATLTSSGPLASRPTSTPGSPGISGRRYYATDTGVEYRDTGTGWIALGVELVTALPASPYNGQIVDYLADATNGVVWRLRYRSASASAYKWECIGSSDLSSYVGTSETLTADSTWRDVATVGPSITVPLAGDYLWMARAEAQSPSADVVFSTGLALGAGTPADAEIVNATLDYAHTSRWTAVSTHNRFNALAAGNELRLRYWMNGLNGPVRRRRLAIRPVRVG